MKDNVGQFGGTILFDQMSVGIRFSGWQSRLLIKASMTKMNAYVPHPLDTSKVQLPMFLTGLLEKLAENTHEVWASQRIKDGWSYGAKRDDVNKTSPCLVSYDQLPEFEKEYDRRTASEVLKSVIALGYEIREA